jgi:hypothetical protein
VFGAIVAKPQGKTCHAILGIVEEGEEIALSLLPDRDTMFGVQTHGNQTSWPKAFQACQKQARLDKKKESELSHMARSQKTLPSQKLRMLMTHCKLLQSKAIAIAANLIAAGIGRCATRCRFPSSYFCRGR